MTNREKYSALKQGVRTNGILPITAFYQVTPETDPYVDFDSYTRTPISWRCTLDATLRPALPALTTLDNWRDNFEFPVPTYDVSRVNKLSEFRSTQEGVDSLILHSIDGILYRLWCVIGQPYVNSPMFRDPGSLQGLINDMVDDYFIPRITQYNEMPCDVIMFRDDILDASGKYDQDLWDIFLKPAYKKLCQATQKDVWFHDAGVYSESIIEDLVDCGFTAICGVYEGLNITLANNKNRLLVLGGSDFLYNCEQRQFDLTNPDHVGPQILESKVFFDKYVSFIPFHNCAVRPYNDENTQAIYDFTKDWAGQPPPIADWTPLRDPFVEPTAEELINTLLDGLL